MPRRSDPELASAIGARLSRIRQLHGLTQEQLAEAAGLEALTLSRCETGARSLSLANLHRVATVLGVGLGDLVDVCRDAPQPDEPGELAWRLLWREMSPQQRDCARRMLVEFLR
jgi:transcriptional regulator with XRE-family HTH domain